MSDRIIFLRPEYCHPSSLWPSQDLIVSRANRIGFYLPEDLGIKPDLGNEILGWTEEFQQNFFEKPDSFHQRPRWTEQFDRFRWYEEGWSITCKLRELFPSVQIVPQFAQFVFSVNELRENAGKKPLCLPGEQFAGFVSIRDVRNDD